MFVMIDGARYGVFDKISSSFGNSKSKTCQDKVSTRKNREKKSSKITHAEQLSH